MTEKKKKKESVTIEEKGSNGLSGRILMSEDVVAQIAGMAAREIDGIHSLGRSRLIEFGDDPSRGVEAEVGKKEAALDLEVIIDYGCDIRKVADELRTRVADEVDKMAGRHVIEVNLDVVGVNVPESEQDEGNRPRRVV